MLCAEQILSANEFTVSVFYVLQIILIVVLLKYKVDPCPDKVGLTFDHPLFRKLTLDFHLDRGQRSKYRIYWSATPLGIL